MMAHSGAPFSHQFMPLIIWLLLVVVLVALVLVVVVVLVVQYQQTQPFCKEPHMRSRLALEVLP
jgi:heme/copper-type cytochrome/quinol oxidase subunit 2